MAVVSDFPEVLAELTNEGGYFAEQVFNADEIGLGGGACAHILQQEKSLPSYRASKEWLALLPGDSTADDFTVVKICVHLKAF